MLDDPKDPLDLNDDQVLDDTDQDDAPGDLPDDGDDGETVIAFADEAEEGEEEPDLVKKLRGEIRERDRKLAQYRRSPPAADNDTDAEPVIPAKPRIEEFDYDQDKFDAATDARDAAVVAHAEWKSRQSEREAQRTRQSEEQARQIEQQRKALGVSDYDERSAAVRERLSDAQIAILTNGAQNPARLIYALGRSPGKLDQLAGEDNLARFAVMLGSLEKDIKVTKRTPPSADTPVRGATASASLTTMEKQLKKLEEEAERTGERTELRKFRQKMRDRQKAA